MFLLRMLCIIMPIMSVQAFCNLHIKIGEQAICVQDPISKCYVLDQTGGLIYTVTNCTIISYDKIPYFTMNMNRDSDLILKSGQNPISRYWLFLPTHFLIYSYNFLVGHF
jgi:hypothetical protein